MVALTRDQEAQIESKLASHKILSAVTHSIKGKNLLALVIISDVSIQDLALAVAHIEKTNEVSVSQNGNTYLVIVQK